MQGVHLYPWIDIYIIYIAPVDQLNKDSMATPYSSNIISTQQGFASVCSFTLGGTTTYIGCSILVYQIKGYKAHILGRNQRHQDDTTKRFSPLLLAHCCKLLWPRRCASDAQVTSACCKLLWPVVQVMHK